MKAYSKITQAGLALVVLASTMFAGGRALADVPGQIEGGNSNYLISNVMQGTGFSNTQSANPGDTVEYRLHLYNPGPSAISDVKVEATINSVTPTTSYISTATAFAPSALNTEVNFTSKLNISSPETQSYVKNSTELLDGSGNVIKSSANGTLADTITDGAGGIDIGSLGESVDEYVEFKALINAPAPTPAVCNSLSAPTVSNNTVKVALPDYSKNDANVTGVTLNFGNGVTNTYQVSQFPVSYTYPKSGNYTITATVNTNLGNVTSDSCAKPVTVSMPNTPTPTPPAPVVTTPPTSLSNTGPGDVVGIFAATTIAGAVAHRIFKSRRTSRSSL